MALVTVRYWAGAREAAGHDQEELRADTVSQLVALLGGRGERLAQVLGRSSMLLDGLVVHHDAELSDGQTLEVLPPFAGG